MDFFESDGPTRSGAGYMPGERKASTDLLLKKAAGKSPLFPPIGEKKMLEEIRELTSRAPQALGHSRSRWTLGLLQDELGEKAPETEAGTWQIWESQIPSTGWG